MNIAVFVAGLATGIIIAAIVSGVVDSSTP